MIFWVQALVNWLMQLLSYSFSGDLYHDNLDLFTFFHFPTPLDGLTISRYLYPVTLFQTSNTGCHDCPPVLGLWGFHVRQGYLKIRHQHWLTCPPWSWKTLGEKTMFVQTTHCVYTSNFHWTWSLPEPTHVSFHPRGRAHVRWLGPKWPPHVDGRTEKIFIGTSVTLPWCPVESEIYPDLVLGFLLCVYELHSRR